MHQQYCWYWIVLSFVLLGGCSSSFPTPTEDEMRYALSRIYASDFTNIDLDIKYIESCSLDAADAAALGITDRVFILYDEKEGNEIPQEAMQIFERQADKGYWLTNPMQINCDVSRK